MVQEGVAVGGAKAIRGTGRRGYGWRMSYVGASLWMV